MTIMGHYNNKQMHCTVKVVRERWSEREKEMEGERKKEKGEIYQALN